MRKIFIITLICSTIVCLAQKNNPIVLSEYDAIEILENKGLDELQKIITPMDLVMLNDKNSQLVINSEFSKSMITKHPDSVGIYCHYKPETTIKIATEFHCKYAGEKLFDYYKSIPKSAQSDTLYFRSYSLDDLLSILIYYQLEGLTKKLELDFYEWQNLSSKTPKKKYKSIEQIVKEMRDTPIEVRLKESQKLKDEDFNLDCHWIAYQIAEALHILKHPNFNSEFLTGLKSQQTYFLKDKYIFPKFTCENLSKYKFKYDVKETILDESSTNLESLVTEYNKLEQILHEQIEDCCGSKISKIVYDKNQNTYIEFSRNNGNDGYWVKLDEGKLLTQWIWSIEE